jgi:hypothetical protein
MKKNQPVIIRFFVYPTINYHHHAQPYYYGGGRGFLGNLLSGSTLPTSKLLIHDTVKLITNRMAKYFIILND